MIPAIVAALGEAGAAGATAEGVGAASGAMSSGMFNQVIGQVTNTLNQIAHPLQTFEKGLDTLRQRLTALPAVILKVQQTIVGVADTWLHALAAPIDTVKRLGDAVGRFTRLANPAQLEIFNYKVENTLATIGRILEPIMDALTRSAEKVGDTFGKLKPALEPAARAVAGLIDSFTDLAANSVDFLSTAFANVSYSFVILAETLKFTLGPVNALIHMLAELRRQAMEFLGLPVGFDPEGRSDVAVRAPRYRSTEEIQREMARNSLMASLGTTQQTRDMPNLLQMLLQKVDEYLSPQKLAEVISEGVRRARNELDPRPETPTRQQVADSPDDARQLGIEWQRQRDLDRQISEKRRHHQE